MFVQGEWRRLTPEPRLHDRAVYTDALSAWWISLMFAQHKEGCVHNLSLEMIYANRR